MTTRKGLLRRRASRRSSGFTLVELLVATVVAGVVLSAAYGWLWNVGALAQVTDERTQADTIAAAAARAVGRDIRSSLRVTRPEPAYRAAHALALLHDHVSVAPEAVSIVWDSARRVLWRNASGTYIADHITGFDVAYRTRAGAVVPGDAMADGEWAEVTAVQVALSCDVGSERATRSLLIEVGS